MNVRDATFDVMRRFGMTTIFGNPGSTEVSFLTDLPDDIEFVLGLHEGTVVGIAAGYAIARGEPSFVNLHTAPGLGNAINAIANARDCRAPLVIVVGQQDRRQIAFEPFLTGRALERMAGEYPVWSSLPVRAQDVPGAIARAYHEARAGKGPALVVVPMGDWLEEADELAAGCAGVDRASRLGGGRGPRAISSSSSAKRTRPCSSSAPAPTAARDGTPSSRWPSVSAAGSGRSRSVVVPVSPRTTRCSPAICRGCAGGCTRSSRATTACSRSARAHFAHTCSMTPSRS